MKPQLVLVVDNVRSAHNIGSIFRSCDGLGVNHVYLSGYSPYPKNINDTRLPHLARRTDAAIHKTALGAEKTVAWTHFADSLKIIKKLKAQNYQIVALEQTDKSINLSSLGPRKAIALVVGNEIKGLSQEVLKAADIRVQIPMLGQKESLNVAVAAAIALYHLRYPGKPLDNIALMRHN